MVKQSSDPDWVEFNPGIASIVSMREEGIPLANPLVALCWVHSDPSIIGTNEKNQ